MKVKTLFLLLILFLLSLTLAIGPLYAEPQIASKPDYKNVDLVIKCDWGVSDKIESVTVYDHSDAKEPHLTISEPNGELYEIILAKGIIVSILNHENHELLKTYVGKYVKQ